MNKQIVLALGICMAISTCMWATPVGRYFTSVTEPLEIGKGVVEYTKKGKCSSSSFLMLFGGGNCSVEQIASANGISKIGYVDKHTSSLWFFTLNEEYIVYGN